MYVAVTNTKAYNTLVTEHLLFWLFNVITITFLFLLEKTESESESESEFPKG